MQSQSVGLNTQTTGKSKPRAVYKVEICLSLYMRLTIAIVYFLVFLCKHVFFLVFLCECVDLPLLCDCPNQ
jgi:hypothetical protein